MSNNLIIIENSLLEASPAPALIPNLADRAREYAGLARAANTRTAYSGDVRGFSAWCEPMGACSFPAAEGTVLAYLIDRAGKLKVSTLRRKLTAIREWYASAGHPLETKSRAFRDAWIGIQREHAQPANKKKPLLTAELRRAVAILPDSLAGKRDRALILVGFAAALRRSELASLELARRDGAAWIEERSDGLVVHLGRSKTDQQGDGAEIGVPYGGDPSTCPVRNFRAWVKASRLKTGPAFRAINRNGKMRDRALTGRSVAQIVKNAVAALALAEGATPDEAARRAAAYSGHSLRSGLATSAAANDAPGHAIQRQLRHKRFDTTSGYIRSGQLFKQNPAGMAGL